MTLYTRTGDGGETSLLDGTRVPKSFARVEACGEVDELHAWLGLVRADVSDAEVTGMLGTIQRDLLAVGSRLADPGNRIGQHGEKTKLCDEHVSRLEAWIDRLDSEVPTLRNFILAGGSHGGAELHVARTVCRRAERRIVALGTDGVDPQVRVYLNRLSDLLFALARVVNRRSGANEEEW